MSTNLVSRYLGPTDRHQRMSIKLNPEDYRSPASGAGNKWGLITLTISSISIANLSGSPISGVLGTVDIRPSQYNVENDNILLTEAITNSPYTHTLMGKKYCFAVNNGVIGPGAFVEPDGSWDLLDIKYDLPDGYALDQVQLTVNYTISFTDLTPSGPSAGASQAVLHVDNDKTADFVIISDSSFAGTLSGYISCQLASYDLEVADKPDFADPVDLLDVAHKNDSVPLLIWDNLRTPYSNYSKNMAVLTPMSKSGGHSTFNRCLYVFAVNGSKIDANGSAGHGYDRVNLVRADLFKWPPYPCDDVVDLKLNYDITRSLS
jgi:hypothetical protein